MRVQKNLEQFGKFIAGLVNRKKPEEVQRPDPGVPPQDYIGFEPQAIQPPPPPPQTSPFTAKRNPQIGPLMKSWEEAQAQLGAAPPKASTPTLGENIASALIGNFATNPTVQSKAFAAPGVLAGQRTAQALQDYELSMKAAQNRAKGAETMIGMLQDADEAANKVEAQVQMATMKGAITQAVADAKNNTVLVKALANLEASGGITENNAAMIMQRIYPEWEWDAAVEAGKQLYAKYMNDPSMKMALERDRVAIQGEKASGDKRAKARTALTAVNGTKESRLSAMMELADAGDPMFAGMTYKDMLEAADHVGAQTKLAEEKGKTESEMRPQKVKNLLSQGNVLDARAAKIEAETALVKIREKYLPQELQAKIKASEALATKREKEANDSLYSLGSGRPVTATAYFNQITSVRKSLADMEARRDMVDQEIKVYQSKIDNIDDKPLLDKDGNQVKKEQAVQELQGAIDEAKAGRVYYDARSKALRAVLNDIEKQGQKKEPVKKWEREGTWWKQGPISAKPPQKGGKAIPVKVNLPPGWKVGG